MQVTPEKKETPPAEGANRSAEAKPETGKIGEDHVEPKVVWRPIIAALLSLVFAGLGHLYLRLYGRAFLYLFLGLLFYQLSDYSPRSMIFNVILFIFSAFDAFSFGKRGYGII